MNFSSQNCREYHESNFLGQILVCALSFVIYKLDDKN